MLPSLFPLTCLYSKPLLSTYSIPCILDGARDAKMKRLWVPLWPKNPGVWWEEKDVHHLLKVWEFQDRHHRMPQKLRRGAAHLMGAGSGMCSWKKGFLSQVLKDLKRLARRWMDEWGGGRVCLGNLHLFRLDVRREWEMARSCRGYRAWGHPAKGLLAFILWACGNLWRVNLESNVIRMTLVAE